MNKKCVTIPSLLNRKKNGKKISALTAYDSCFAKLLDTTDIDLILVGDSVGMVALGHDSTLPVTMEDMVYHTRAVKRGLHNPLLVGDMPFMSYQVSDADAIANAGRLIQEGGAEAVKLEGGAKFSGRVEAIVNAGISVMGHIGLTPQSVHQFGGYKVQGKNYTDGRLIKKDALALQKAGVFSIVLEGIPTDLAREITEELSIPTIGIGAGPHCDGQILVLHDMLGLNLEFTPKFVKRYAEMGSLVQSSVENYVKDVQTGSFPSDKYSYTQRETALRRVMNDDSE